MHFLKFAHCYILVTVIPCESISAVVTSMSKITGKGWWPVSAGTFNEGKPRCHSVTHCSLQAVGRLSRSRQTQKRGFINPVVGVPGQMSIFPGTRLDRRRGFQHKLAGSGIYRVALPWEIQRVTWASSYKDWSESKFFQLLGSECHHCKARA